MKFPIFLKVYGNQSHRDKKCPTESAEQATFFNYIKDIEPTAMHIKNEGKRTHYQAQRDKSQGMKAGAPDIIIPGAPTFLCELKRKDHTLCKWQPKQQEFLENAQKNGAFVCVALGYESAIEAYKEWKNIGKQANG